MKRKKETIGIISVNEILKKQRNMFHKPTKVESSKKIRRKIEKVRKEEKDF